jgi:hypothetical protein
LDRRLGRPQSLSGCGGEEKNSINIGLTSEKDVNSVRKGVK